MSQPSLYVQYCAVEHALNRPMPGPDMQAKLTARGTVRNAGLRQITRAYVDHAHQLLDLQAKIAEIKNLRDRVLMAEALLGDGFSEDQVKAQLRLRDDQLRAMVADEPVQP